jgi:mannose-1-phosphate guanylyltransferase/mannose-6-phosphate isomerase
MKTAVTNPIVVPTILCGGAGSRLWPVSREQHPKPFIRLEDGESLLQKAFLRGASLPGIRDIITVTNRELIFKIEDDYREISHLPGKPIDNTIILEPFGRNTAPAIAAASLQVAKKHGDQAIMLVLPADHLISDQQSFTNAVIEACALAQDGKIVTFGIQPTGPETAYGYIEADGHEVIQFVEKPTIEKAQDYIRSGNFLWNSGMFCFSVGTMLREMAEHCPEILDTSRICLEHSSNVSGDGLTQVKLSPEYFAPVPDQSIDYAVMEKTHNTAVVACDIGWSDIGCWQALGDLTAPDADNNRIQGDVLLQDCKNNTITSEGRIIGAVGVNDLIVIDTNDALLVAHKDSSQDVKQIYSQLKAQDHEAHKTHSTVKRPWGAYTILEEGSQFKVKRIEVKPGASLSLQMHHHRSEHWVVISGSAKVFNNDQELELEISQSTYIPAGNKHRLENLGTETLVIIEVQTGDYLGEDDIVRFEDVYGRVHSVA